VLRNYLRNYYDDADGLYTLGQNTHQLLVAWLSSFDLKSKSKIITTDSEFHSLSRQLQRLKEEGLEIVALDAYSDEIASNIADQIDEETIAIILSRVYFESGIVNQHLSGIAEIARHQNVPLLVDDYHGTNVVPLSFKKAGLEDCYLLVGGYKYLQWGEGNCFLRFPKDCELRPAVTGWFASFSTLDKPQDEERVAYDKGNQRFASGTYDPASQFRAAKVVEFFQEQGLTSSVLRKQYLSQVKLLKKRFLEQNFGQDVIKLRHERPLEQNGGFLALRSPFARTIRAKLLENGVFTDARGDILRIGPAPYITTQQIEQAISELAKVLKQINP
jgi:selenocysteine lyase/cysteine desulfurase